MYIFITYTQSSEGVNIPPKTNSHSSLNLESISKQTDEDTKQHKEPELKCFVEKFSLAHDGVIKTSL